MSINSRGHHDAKVSSLLLFPLPSHGSATWIVQAKKSVRIKDIDGKLNKLIENYETQNI